MPDTPMAFSQEVELSRLPSTLHDTSNSPTGQPSQMALRLASDSDFSRANTVPELPPVDKGFHAYAYLAGSFVLELLVWALPFSYGVFLNHYTSQHMFRGPQEFLLPLVGTLSSGIIYLTSVVIMPMLSRYPHQRRNLMRFGVLLCCVSLLGAAFATQVWHLILTQGVLYSIGATILYFPVQVYLFEWFDKRRGLANGIIFSGTGLGGVVLPFIVETLLNRYGLKITFISLAIGYAVLLSSVLPFVKGRLPPSSIIIPQRADWSFVWNPQFLVLFIGNFLQGLGNFVPGIWLPTFASDMNLSVTSGTLIVSLMNASAVPGSVVIGFASDRYDLRGVMLASMLGSSLSVLVLWGLASNLALLLVFALMYGFLAGGFSSLWPKFASTVAKDDPHSNARLMSLFIAGRGIGNVLAAPISSSLLRSAFSSGGHAYGLKNYGPLITFTGVALFSSTVGVFYKNVERMVNRGGPGSCRLNPSHHHGEVI
ncbi:hypothetical protein FS749_007009 [Ceratobasidium sp. UAMH 11750]|nr:hypothetical protein FS749_007009 [Ceratobasidium sp. UAMH 11750]